MPKGVHVLKSGVTLEKAVESPSKAIVSLDSSGKLSRHALEVGNFDQKYDESGRFGYDNVKTPEGDEPGRLLRHKAHTVLKLENIHESVSTSGESDDASTDQSKPTPTEVLRNVANSLDADNSCASEKCPKHVTGPADTHEQELPLNATQKRKREPSSTSDVPLTPSNSQPDMLSPMGDDQEIIRKPDRGLLIPSLPMPYPSLFYVSDDEDTHTNNPCVLKDPRAYLHVAQILADQISPQDVDLLSRSSTALLTLVKCSSQCLKSQSDPFESALYRNFPSITQCDLKDFASIGKGTQDQIPTSSSQSVGKQSSAQSQVASSQEELDQLFMINTPLLRVQRMGTQMDISTSALPFWEELGLAPASGEKNVMAFCICPESDFVEEQILVFLESVRSVYQSHKLGSHQLGFGPAGYDGAIVPFTARSDSTESSLDDLFDTCGNLGGYLESY